MIKKITLLIFAALLWILTLTLCSNALNVTPDGDIRFSVYGQYMHPKKPVLLYRNTIMIPVKEFAEYVGINIDEQSFVWNKEESSLSIFYEDTNINIFNNKRRAYKNGETFELTYMPFTQSGILYMSYSDFSNMLGLINVFDEETKTVAICTNQTYFRNKNLLNSISSQLEAESGLEVNINFDYGEESMAFEFKLNKENKVLNGTMLVNKYLENRYITEKSELYIKDQNLYVKDYRVNKWRLDDSGSFDVASSFLRTFSSSYMLKFNDLAYATFNWYDNGSYYELQNNTIFNGYLLKELGFTDAFPFNFRLIADKDKYIIRNVSILNSSYAGKEVKVNRLDMEFASYGSSVAIDIPREEDFINVNADDVRKINSVKKALILFMFDAGDDAFPVIQKSGSVEQLIKLLQTGIAINKGDKGEHSTYGPYLTNPMGSGETDSSYFMPNQNNNKGLKIVIDRKNKSITVEASEKNDLSVK